MKPRICVDFDGVLNNYSGYDKENLGTPRPGAEEFLKKLSMNFYVIIFTVRNYSIVAKWLDHYDLLQYVGDVTRFKRPAVAYIDDRGMCFKGDYEEILEELENFKPYWK